MEGNNRPLALNPWIADAPNSYAAAIEAVNVAIDPKTDPFLTSRPELTQFMQNSLYDRITSQSQANYEQFKLIEPQLTHEQEPFVRGEEQPSNLVLFLYATKGLESIEIARRTHRQWDTYQEVDLPIRYSLDNDPLLFTKSFKSSPLYRIKNLNILGNPSDYCVQVDRKRTIRQHFGGRVLTVVRNSFVVHDVNSTMPRSVRQHIRREREEAIRNSEQNRIEYNYDKHSPIFHEQLEKYVMNRDAETDVSWVVPILTNYYSVKRRSVSNEHLLELDSSASQDVT